jgi:hypothetical protein
MGFIGQARQFLAVLLLFPLTLGAAITVTDRGTGHNGTSEASTAMSPTSTIAAGSTGTLCIAADNANGTSTNMPTSITDSVGNVWYLVQGNAPSSGAANTSAEQATFYAPNLTTQVTSSDTITVTYTAANVTAKCWAFYELAPATAGNIILHSQSPKASGFGNTASPSTGNSTQNISVGGVTIGMGAAESADTWVGDADTSNGSWSTKQSTAQGTGATGMSIITQYKVQTTAASTQSFDPTLTIADSGCAETHYYEVAPNVRGIGANTVGGGATTYVVGPGKTLTAGKFAVLCVSLDNLGANGAVTASDAGPITDSAGNTWTRNATGLFDNGAAAAGAELAIYSSLLTANLAGAVGNGGTITLTWAGGLSVVSKAFVLMEFTPTAGTAYTFSTTTSSTGTTGTPSVTQSITSGDLVIGVGSSEGVDTWAADADTTNGAWSGQASASAGATTSGMAIIAQYKSATGTGNQTFNPTQTSVDTVVNIANYTPVTTQSATNGFFDDN